jgi:cell division protein FtsB|tara:strand:+ start:255 stop:434 length:180 start_codon:yes stop_codon:yes gene_type:complete
MDTFVREGKALLETNLSGLERYKLLREQKQKEQSDINSMKEDIIELKKQVKLLLGKQNG